MSEPIDFSSQKPNVYIGQPSVRPPGSAASEPLERACRDFESIFVNYMLQQMRRTVPQNNLFDGGRAEEIYTSMMDSELSKAVTQQRGMGLASELYRQLSAFSESGGAHDAAEKKIKASPETADIHNKRYSFKLHPGATRLQSAEGDGRKKEDLR